MSCINSARKWVASHKDGRLTVARAGTLHALDQEIQCADDEPERVFRFGFRHALRDLTAQLRKQQPRAAEREPCRLSSPDK